VRPYYDVGDFDEAIAAGKPALVESRHKLAYQTKGELGIALEVIHRGFLYSLDNGDRQEAFELFEHLRGEELSCEEAKHDTAPFDLKSASPTTRDSRKPATLYQYKLLHTYIKDSLCLKR
jgi:hypothetical protein